MLITSIMQALCNHNSGITIVIESIYSAGCSLEHKDKYVKCSRCGKVLIESGVLEEFTGITEETK